MLETYRKHGGRDVAADHVHIYELGLIAGWYRDAVSRQGPDSARSEVDHMRGMLRRLP